MTPTLPPYGQSLSLLTDLYELTMACGYWKSGLAEREAVFHLYFRHHPFGGGYTVACGLGPAVAFLRGFHFDESDLAYLRGLRAADGGALLDPAFVDALGQFEFRCDVDAIPEGSIVFPQEPLLRVRGPLLQCQILETALLNIVNFQTLIATKASRIVEAAQGDPVLEFGLRRAQGVDGALSASRAAYVGGCAATSNVLAGKIYGIPVRGTHAHSWVMSFEDEAEAFEAWARAMPNNCVFLVDTYDSIEGVRRAIKVARGLRERGYEMLGVRLDSGDLTELSREARRLLDEAGFPDAKIVASGDLDERAIAELKQKGSQIALWGVGTRLVTAHDDPSLGGVYKLGAIRGEDGSWSDRVKLSDDLQKVSNPGVLQVRRFSLDGEALGDVIFDERRDLEQLPFDVPPFAESEDLLQPVIRDGLCLYEPPGLPSIRRRAAAQKALFPQEALHKGYRVGLEKGLAAQKQQMMDRYGVSVAAGEA
ncbi:MAG: nicotinate phosphoribosyltransferase [Acidobacteria bacterium]|nr:nicotinate phosphoribosyltransferase [Acidobacteriota bacterium]